MKPLLDSNIQILQKYIPNIKEAASRLANRTDLNTIQTVSSRTADPTVEVSVGGKSVLMHSKYDPRNEAKQWVESKQEQMENAKQVFFYGLGLGYHVEELVKKHPNIRITIFEPSPVMFYKFISERDLQQFPFKNMQQLHVEMQEDDTKAFLYKLMSSVAEELILLELPAYTRVFSDKYKRFLESFKEVMSSKRSNVVTEFVFASRWTLNALMNLPHTIKTPNLLSVNMDHMKGKHVIIVSAGPGLSYEYENLRRIKDNNLAYIIAVGTANRALFREGIYPDAVASYDPKETNWGVFKSIIDQKHETIPMIYGTSVGYETLEKYTGKKYHTITNKDIVTPYYVNNNQEMDVVTDAPSIAVVTYQLLAKLKCNPIIFVGQNFCLEDKYAYAKEAEYGQSLAQVKQNDIDSIIPAIDLNGNQVETLPGYLSMKRDLEWYISLNIKTSTINTTRGGLEIAGAQFKALEALVADWSSRKDSKGVADMPLFPELNITNKISNIKKQVENMEDSIRDFSSNQADLSKLLRNIQDHHDRRQINRLVKDFNKFDVLWHLLMKNDFFNVYIKPILQVKFEILLNRSSIIQNEHDVIKRSEVLLKEFKHFFYQCQEAQIFIANKVKAVHQFITTDKEKNKQWKHYFHDIGVLKYSGKWQRINYHHSNAYDEEQRYRYGSTLSNDTGSIIEFRFTGSALRVLACKSAEHSKKIKISIDGSSFEYSQYSDSGTAYQPDLIEELVFEVTSLENQEHNVRIELQDESYISIAGIEIDSVGSVYHLDEVSDISDLQIGKRIRCHYKANSNQVGSFSGYGDETGDFIPPESLAEPDGDFYFIMVDKTDAGEEMMIADRIVQHTITWETLDEAGMVYGKQIGNMSFRLLEGGRAYNDEHGDASLEYKGLGVWPNDNEWDKYIHNDRFNQKFDWNYTEMGTWCQESPLYSGNDLAPEMQRIIRGEIFSNRWNAVVPLYAIASTSGLYLRGYRPVCNTINGKVGE